MYRGYIKMWRKSLDAGWLRNHKLWAFWSWCLMKASHKEMDVIVGYQKIHLLPGEFIFGRHKASKELKMSEQSIRTCIKTMLKTHQNLTIKTTNKYSTISIVNWDIYQEEENKDNQQFNQQLTNKQPTTNQQLTTNKNVKNVKNVKNNTFIRPSFEEIAAFCLERNNSIDPEQWFSYYESNGWLIGKNKMKNWKAAVISWEKRSGGQDGSRTIRSTGASLKKEGRAKSDGEPYPVDYEFS